jgi:hypothetical protein
MSQYDAIKAANAAYSKSRPQGQLPMPPARKAAVVVRAALRDWAAGRTQALARSYSARTAADRGRGAPRSSVGPGSCGSCVSAWRHFVLTPRLPQRSPCTQICMDARIMTAAALGLQEG